jgi:hypothetical protein
MLSVLALYARRYPSFVPVKMRFPAVAVIPL